MGLTRYYNISFWIKISNTSRNTALYVYDEDGLEARRYGLNIPLTDNVWYRWNVSFASFDVVPGGFKWYAINNIRFLQQSESQTGHWYWIDDISLGPPLDTTWSNVTKTLNNTVGLPIGWRIYANDISNNWNTSEVFTLTTTDETPPSFFNNQSQLVSTYTPTSYSNFSVTWNDNSGNVSAILPPMVRFSISAVNV